MYSHQILFFNSYMMMYYHLYCRGLVKYEIRWKHMSTSRFRMLLSALWLGETIGYYRAFLLFVSVITCHLLVLKPGYSEITRSISLLLIPWLHALPGHQQPWYLMYCINKSLSSTGKDFQLPAPSQGWGMIENSNIFWCFLKWIERAKCETQYINSLRQSDTYLHQ